MVLGLTVREWRAKLTEQLYRRQGVLGLTVPLPLHEWVWFYQRLREKSDGLIVLNLLVRVV